MAEGNQEIPIATPKEQSLDTKLKKDSVDLVVTGVDSYRLYCLSAASITASLTAMALGTGYTFAPTITLATFGAKDVFKMAQRHFRSQKIEKTHSISDETLGYRADRCVYQGNQPIEVGGQKFTKGDNFYYLQLPFMPQKVTESPESMDAWLDVYNYSLKEIKERLVNKNYQFVAIEGGQSIEGAQSVSRKDLLAGKKDKTIKEQEKQSLIFTREEFENLTELPQEIFEKLTSALDDEAFFHFISLAKQAKTADEKSNAKDLVKRRLNQIILREVEMYFNSTPEVVKRMDRSLIPERQKIYQRSLIQQTETGLLFVTVNDAEGEVHSTPLDMLLKTKDQPVEEILASTRPIKKAQVAYLIHNVLRETELEDLIKEPVQNKEDIIKKLRAYGISIPNSTYRVSDLVEKKIFPPGRFGKIRPFLAPLIVYASIQQGISHFEDLKNIKEIVNPTAIVRTIEEQGIQFPDSLPQSGLDWKIEGTMPSDGYFITETSHVFKDRHWEKNEEIKKPVEFPHDIVIEQDESYLIVSRTIPTNWLGNTTFKIPIKENTQVTALGIIGPTGYEVEFKAYELTDGTVQVMIPNRLNNPAFIIVGAKLSPQPQNTVHASQHLQPINAQKLSEEAQDIIKKAGWSPSNPSKELFKQIAQDHEYSLDPPNKEKLKDAETPEEIVNTIVELKACICEICNTAAVLASSVWDGASVNMAYGYIGIGNHPAGASTQGFLRSETAHAFGVDEKGQILDATATKAASDKLTQDYLKLLGNPAGGDADAAWNQQRQEIINQANQKKNLTDKLKILAGIAAAAASGFGLYQGIRILRKPEIQEKIGAFSDDIFMSIYSTKDLQKSYEFFEWLSWGREESSLPSSKPSDFSNKQQGLTKIRNILNYEKLAQYLERPRAFERLALKRKGMIAIGDKFKLRSLASYLLG